MLDSETTRFMIDIRILYFVTIFTFVFTVIPLCIIKYYKPDGYRPNIIFCGALSFIVPPFAWLYFAWAIGNYLRYKPDREKIES